MTRVQKERFFNEEDYLRLKDSYILTPDKLKLAKSDMIVLHPLPRVNEISTAVDDDPRAAYFRQVRLRQVHPHGAHSQNAGGKGMNIDSIKNGLVIDHITAGKAMRIYNMLHLGELDCQVAIIKNAHSTKMGKKDIIKIDSAIDIDLDVLGYMSPHITVDVIRDGQRVEKKHIELPETLTNILRCKNPRCITRCAYCDTEKQRGL
jgi:aspartate carbamoyltransferase regulatory subunit